jgi:hypothetical protein
MKLSKQTILRDKANMPKVKTRVKAGMRNLKVLY